MELDHGTVRGGAALVTREPADVVGASKVTMRSGAVGGWLLVLAVAAAACSAADPLDTGSTDAPPPATASIVPPSSSPTTASTVPLAAFEPPRVAPFDPGVALSVVVPGPDVRWGDLLEGLLEAGPPTAVSVEVQLDSCIEVGPQQWRVDGSAMLPHGVAPATVLFQFVTQAGDIIESMPVELAVRVGPVHLRRRLPDPIRA